MGIISQLAPHIADLIAAGEVVERPASAAKELVENSIDAMASAITVEIRRGGVAFLRVTDDGSGMDEADARAAFLRHATSKIKSEEDLKAILTLGFRGEALAALAAVSRIELLTRENGALYGTCLTLEGGTLTGQSETGCPAGTTVIVRDLFFNTPARQKFLKKDVTEALQVQGVAVRAAQSHPEIAFTFINDGRETLRTPGNGQLSACLHSLWGRDVSSKLVSVSGEHQGCSISGFLGRPELTRGSREMEYFFVNGRSVRSRTMTAALDEAFRHSAPQGRYPVCSLHIKMPETLYDVNVHPSKQEIKFVFERAIFELVYAGVRDALLESPRHPVWSASAQPAAKPKIESQPYVADEKKPSYAASRIGILSIENPIHARVSTPKPVAPQEQTVMSPKDDYRYIGEALGGFLLVEREDELVLIDKHAAHERLLYDRFQKNVSDAVSQTLIAPVVVTLSPDDCAVLGEHAELLEGVGLSVDGFGEGSLAVRAVPDNVLADELDVLLSELSSLLRKQRRAPWEERREAALSMMACKAAVKVGRRFSHSEAMEVVGWVMRDRSLWHCPHGRPVAVALTRTELNRQFGR